MNSILYYVILPVGKDWILCIRNRLDGEKWVQREGLQTKMDVKAGTSYYILLKDYTDKKKTLE